MRKVFLVIVALSVMSVPVAAQDTSIVDDLIGSEDEETQIITTWAKDRVNDALAAASGFADRARYAFGVRVGLESQADPSNEINKLQEEIAQNGTLVYQDYINERVVADNSSNVLRISFLKETDDGWENQSIYAYAEVRNGNFTGLTAVDDQSKIELEDSSVDHWIELKGFAVKHVNDEVDLFRNEWIDPGESIPRGQIVKLGAKYKGYVRSDLLGQSGGFES